MKRSAVLLKGALALGALGVLVGVVPLLLLQWGRLDALRAVDWRNIWLLPDSGGLFMGLLTLLAWMAWAGVVVAIGIEAVGALSGRLARRSVPGSGWFRPVARWLLAAVLAAVALVGLFPAVLGASEPETAVPDPIAQSDEVARSEPDEVGATAPRSAEVAEEESEMPQQRGRRHLVVPGDDLWSLAERYLDAGSEWRQIADANPTLVLDPACELVVGQLLQIPDVAGVSAATLDDAPAVDEAAPGTAESAATTLWEVAQPQVVGTVAEAANTAAGEELAPQPASVGSDAGGHEVPALVAPTGFVPRELSDVGRLSAPEPPVVVLPSALVDATIPEAQLTADISSATSVTSPPNDRHPSGAVRAEFAVDDSDGWDWAAIATAVGPIGSGVAAGLIGALMARRAWQLRTRRLGRAVPQTSTAAARLRSGLEIQARASAPPPGTSVQLGWTDAGTPVELNLAGAGLIAIEGPTLQLSGFAAGVVCQLLERGVLERPHISLIGPELTWLAELDEGLEHSNDHASGAARVQAHLQRRQLLLQDPSRRAELRQHLDLAESWQDQLFVFTHPVLLPPGADLAEFGITVLAPAAGSSPSVLVCLDSPTQAHLEPDGASFRPQLIEAPQCAQLAELVAGVLAVPSEVAPWWEGAASSEAAVAPAAGAGAALGPTPVGVGPAAGASAVPVAPLEPVPTTGWVPRRGLLDPTPLDATHPLLRVLGPIELLHAKGTPPPRALKQCQEYCAWLLRHPDATATQMGQALFVAEGTRRSNMSRLRTWLGVDPSGSAYLPDAYSGYIRLHPQVSSDWERFQMQIAGGVPKASDQALRGALELVRGVPLADAQPGQWGWAEDWRIEMICCIRDVGVELANRALEHSDFEVAGWASALVLQLCPNDELALMLRIRLAAGSGDRTQAERLIMQVTRSARAEGVDLSEPMVECIRTVLDRHPSGV